MVKTPTSGPDRDFERGFSLLELLIVVTLLGALTWVGAQALPNWSQSPILLRAGLSKILQDARQLSLRTGGVVSVDCRILEQKLFELLDQEKPSAIPYECGSAIMSPSSRDAIVFYPDGSSSGGEVSFELEERQHLEVDWYTSRMIWE